MINEDRYVLKKLEGWKTEQKIELTNMCMVYDRNNDSVIVQERVLNWTGISFPGGHVETGESFMQSAIREVKEETGLTVTNMKPCGIVHWDHLDTGDKYLVFLYRTEDFTGEMISETKEGKVYWMKLDELMKTDPKKLSPNFHEYLKLFLTDHFVEWHTPWRDSDKTYKADIW